MTNWKPGMKAVCIDAYAPELRRFGVYTVTEVSVCKCPIVWLSIGIRSPHGTLSICPQCGDDSPSNEFEYEADAFRPLLGDEQRELDAIEEQVSVEQEVEAYLVQP